MTDLNKFQSDFSERLDTHRAEHAARLDQELKALRAHLIKSFNPSIPDDLDRRADQLASAGIMPQAQPLVDITGSTRLMDLDEGFMRAFDLGKYYPLASLRYPTVYCETLEEFFSPLIKQIDLSAQGRQAQLDRLIQEAREMAEKTGGGILGFNLPGVGAYLNGWLLTYNTDVPPAQALSHPDLASRIFGTAVHEKLGHGFLAAYSELGRVKTRLGLTQVDLAARFGFRSSDDPTFSLRREQANLLFMVSQLLEEGWATWLEKNFVKPTGQSGNHPRYTFKQVLKAIRSLPMDIPDRNEIVQTLVGAITVLFEVQPVDLEILHKAIMILEAVGGGLDEFLGHQLGQPLRYAVGELIMTQAEANLGAKCVGYAALIAANVSFDPATVSLTDLGALMGRDPRLHPDTRMAALSRLRISERDNVPLLTKQAYDELSFSVPRELQRT